LHPSPRPPSRPRRAWDSACTIAWRAARRKDPEESRDRELPHPSHDHGLVRQEAAIENDQLHARVLRGVEMLGVDPHEHDVAIRTGGQSVSTDQGEDMTRPPMQLSRAARRATLVGIVVLIASGIACGRKDSPKAAPPSGNDKAAAADNGPLKCEAFMTKDEATALGLDTKRYGELATLGTGAVTCNLGDVSAVIWRGDLYASTVDSIKANSDRTGVVVEDGPKVGAGTMWVTIPSIKDLDGKSPHTIYFLAPNKKFTASLSGSDQSKLVRVAQALQARFEKM
jgi:hypothetical protein